jgi:hypothetical protein
VTYDPNQPPRSPFGTPEPGQPGAGQPTPQPGYPVAGQPAQQPPMQPVQPVAPSFIPPSVAAAAGKPKSGGRISAGTVVFTAALIVAAVGVGFAAGRVTAPATPNRTAFTGQFGGGNGQFGGPNASGSPGNGNGNGNRGFGGAFVGGGAANISIDGKVTAVSNGSITIQTANGQSVTLQVPSTATYHAQAPANASDVIVGSSVQVSVGRPTGPEASGQPAPSGSPTTGGGNGNGNGNGRNFGFGMSVTDITVLSK